MWKTARPTVTAEWLCTRCGATNRLLTAPTTEELRDRCMSCGLAHCIAPDESPVRWRARAA